MVHDCPKTPLLRTDGERGFVFQCPEKAHNDQYGVKVGMGQNRQEGVTTK